MTRDEIKTAARAITEELLEAAKLRRGEIVAVGCSTSEIGGGWMGTESSPEIGSAVCEGVLAALDARGLHLAAQCCEHLNRALIVERGAAEKYGLEIVNAVPRPKAGGSFAAAAYTAMREPVAVSAVSAAAGLDIGGTIIGMHLRRVAVPVKLSRKTLGDAAVVAARTRPPFTGGARAEYDETLL